MALFQKADIKAFKSIQDEDFKHAEALHVLIRDLVNELGWDIKDLEAVAVSQGPGSYTGLRVGVSAAKGLCYALGIPLIAVNTLQLITSHARELSGIKPHKFAAMIDARREEIYLQEFDADLNPLSPARALIFTDEIPAYTHTVCCGDGSEKAKNYIQGEGNVFVPKAIALANHMGTFAFAAFEQKKFEDVAYFEPFYLKEFYTKGK